MKYPRSGAYEMVKDEIVNAYYPEILRVDVEVDVSAMHQVMPLDAENIVELTKRVYREADAYWLLMVINGVLSPFEALAGPVYVPDGRALDEVYTKIMEATG